MSKKTDVKLLFSLIIVAIVWGTTYLGIRVAVETIQPWYVTSIRHGIAAAILLSILLFNKQLKWIGWNSFFMQLISSLLMIVFANGFVTFAEQTLPSGLTSILGALSPLVVYLLGSSIGIEKFSLKGFTGIIVGFIGVLFIFKNGLDDILDPNYKTGILFISIAILSWSLGTVYTKFHSAKVNNISLNLFYQFSIATVVQLLLAKIFHPNVDMSLWSFKSFAAVVYLAIFGSVLAFFCYHYAIKRVSAIEVSVLNYINTIIAVFLGWLLLNEVITFDFIIATLLIILGVFITNYKKK